MIFNDFKEKCPFLAKTLSKHLTYLKYIDTVGFFLNVIYPQLTNQYHFINTCRNIIQQSHFSLFHTNKPYFGILLKDVYC